MVKIPDKEEHRRRFAALGLAERREIVRAVNRGRPTAKRKHAPLAVVIARRQQRLWRWAWLVGPAVGLIQFREGWEVVLLNAALGGGALYLVSRFWYFRALRAEAANLALAEGRKRDAEALGQTGMRWPWQRTRD